MRLVVEDSGLVRSVQTYSINNRTISMDIEIDKYVSNKTKRWKVKSKLVINIIVMNLLACSKRKHRLFYSRQKNKKAKTIYNKRGVSNYDIMKAIDELEALGYLVNHVAPRQYDVEEKMSSWIEPTAMFVSEFITDTELLIKADNAFIAAWMPVIMKDEDKNPVDFRADENTWAISKVINRLNDVNNDHVFVDHEGVEFTNLYSRIFNNSNFEQGGRFFKAAVLNIENKQSKNRLRILIDNCPVVEVDYTSLHLFIMAEKLGIANSLGDDPYALVKDIDRNVVKLAVNTMFNCTSRTQAVKSLNEDLRKLQYKKHSGATVVSAVLNAFPDFKDEFCNPKCSGLTLQNLDSWMTHYVANVMSTLNKPFLPVHDSGIVKVEDKDLLISLMCDAYKNVLGVDSIVHMKASWIENNVVVKEDVSC